MKNIKLLSILLLSCLLPVSCAWPESTSRQSTTSEDQANLEQILELKPFFTDGCTLFIDGPIDRPDLWRHCCVEHDLRYWFGGSLEDRDSSDLRLKACVQKVAGANWANIIYYGVKTGQFSSIKNKTHWNWGWSQKREYGALSLDEVNFVKNELYHMSVPEVDMPDFLKVNFP